MKYLLLIIAIVLIGGGAIYFYENSDSSDSEDASTSQEESHESQQASINSLIASGKSIECTYNFTDEGGNRSQGQAYFANGNMSGEFSTTQADGQQFDSKVLTVSKTQYVWDDDTKEGYKIDLTLVSSGDDNEQSEDDDQTFNQDEEYDFDCHEWSVDDSVFVVPTDVNFVDNSAALQQLQQNTENLSQVCDSITDPAQKAACEQSVN